MPMDKPASIMAQGPGERSLTIPVHLAHLGSGEEHVALLVDLRRFGLLRRWDDLLDEGVAAVFGLPTGEAELLAAVFGLPTGEAELLALSFHAGRFTPARAATWLAERGFKPLLFVPNSGEKPPPLATTPYRPLMLGGRLQAVARKENGEGRHNHPAGGRRPGQPQAFRS
jgi:hypothetical protein